jgi:hypothetical protein
MKQFKFATLLIFSVVVSTVASAQGNRITNRNYSVTPFTSLEVNTVGNIEYTPSSHFSVSAEGSEDLINDLTVTVRNNRLELSTKSRLKKLFGSRQSGKLTIRITAPTLNHIESNGVGNISAPHFASGTLEIRSDGVGNIEIKGTANSVSVESNGVGNVNLADLKSSQVHVESNGVGNVTCHATESLEINSNGVGSVIYYGNPKTRQISRNGVGKVKAGN